MFTRSCLVIVISLCEISFVNCNKDPYHCDIHIKVFYPNNTFETYGNNINLYYNDGDVIGLRCIISRNAFVDRRSTTVTWVDDYDKVYLSKSEPTLDLDVPLTKSQDGSKMHCKAVTKLGHLTLHVNFIKNKTEDELARKKPSVFWILILSICGFVGGSLVLLIIWSLITRLCKKKVKECDTQVIFSEDLENTQNNLTLESRNTAVSEMGISNQCDDLQNDVMENDIERKEVIDSDRREDCRQNSIYVTLDECKRHGSTTEC